VTEISIELVPRSLASLDAELETMRRHFPRVHTVNVPDLLRFEVRSWEACAHARRVMTRAIPHLRAMDVDPARPFPHVAYLREHGLDTVLVVTGDPPQDLARRVHPTRSVDLLRKLSAEVPGLRLIAGFDPYRSGMRQELEYVDAKRNAGARAFFSQPFFDLRLMDVWAEQLRGSEVWWGVSPVLSGRTRRWWETKNRAVFPAGFAPTLEWNRRFAADCLAWARARGDHLYFMPIRADLVEWLGGVLEPVA
jgi:methylenetetrahydrofolate reductase (NADPH)